MTVLRKALFKAELVSVNDGEGFAHFESVYVGKGVLLKISQVVQKDGSGRFSWSIFFPKNNTAVEGKGEDYLGFMLEACDVEIESKPGTIMLTDKGEEATAYLSSLPYLFSGEKNTRKEDWL